MAFEEALFQLARQMALEGDFDLLETYQKLAYQKLGEVLTGTKVQRKQVLEEVEGGIVGWDSQAFTASRQKRQEMLSRNLVKPTASKGVYQCKKSCGSDDFIIWSVQMRGGDEGMSTFRQCCKCGARGREN